ncbi:DNA circularization N-terminal domain-containing protein [Pyxidicoccus trucidator]|uniref:DNA circularization N-terminal domain-containing protein n=1 Tax=Pyxidicoccus trucidator TaxID=2709662 RepID=UPI0013DA0C2F|nr:DNA circularization N-terminal domain-containing protein [Pyxidicoccus trucidator]
MPVRIGRIELTGLTNVYTEDARNLVQQRVPGQSGSVFQDLGREPVTIVMEGILLGDDTQAELEELRQAQMKTTPMSFAADAIAGADLTDVLIADFQVKQLAGHESRFSFFLRVKEYLEPPAAADAGVAAVDDAVADDAASWAEGSVAAAGVLQDPGSLMEAVDANPELLGHLTPDELGSVVNQGKDSLTGKNFSSLLGSLGKVNPAAIGGFVDSLRSAGSLGEFIQKLASEGVSLLEMVKGIDFGAALSLIKAIAGAGDFLAKLQRVAKEATELGGVLADFDPLGPFKDLEAKP